MADDAPVDDVAASEVPPPPEPPTRFGVPLSEHRGQQSIHPGRDGLEAFVMDLRDDHGFNMCIDVTAVDYLDYGAPRELPDAVEAERFEVVYQLLSHANHERLRLRVQVPDDDAVVPSLFDVHPGTEALEREVFDMFGIRFEGHPDLSRILMPEDWIGHPLRRDYAINRIPVQFKAAENER